MEYTERAKVQLELLTDLIKVVENKDSVDMVLLALHSRKQGIEMLMPELKELQENEKTDS